MSELHKFVFEGLPVRGARGGYQLARPATAISAADIIDAVEGPVALTECSSGSGLCGIQTTCTVGHGWQGVSQAIHRALIGISLTDLVSRDGEIPTPDLRKTAARGEWRPLLRG